MYRFLCDQMLLGLGRWLRVAGYDTSLTEDSIQDSEVLERALREKRLLLTLDRHFLNMSAGEKVVVHLSGNSLHECIEALSSRLKINWLYQPFSRCLKCNILLMEVNDEHILQQVPEKIRVVATKFSYCRSCRKVFWEGSHTRRMHDQLQTWHILHTQEE